MKKVIRTCYSRVPILIAVSNSIKCDLMKKYNLAGDNIIVVTNKTDPFKIEIASNEPIFEFEWDHNAKYLINIGRFVIKKHNGKSLKLLST